MLSLLFATFVGGSALVSVSTTGVDVYDSPVALGSRFADILSMLRERHFATPFSTLVALTVAVGGLSLLPRWTPSDRSSLRRASFRLALLCLVSVSQLVLYGAGWPVTLMRYGARGFSTIRRAL